MFTVKHFSNGNLAVYSCIGYDRRIAKPDMLYLKPVPGSGGETEIELDELDEVYIENAAGKTIDLIRPPR